MSDIRKSIAYDAYKTYANTNFPATVDFDSFSEADYGVWYAVADAVTPWFNAPQAETTASEEVPAQSEAA